MLVIMKHPPKGALVSTQCQKQVSSNFNCLPDLSPNGAFIDRMTILTFGAMHHLCPLTPTWLWIFILFLLECFFATVALIIFTVS